MPNTTSNVEKIPRRERRRGRHIDPRHKPLVTPEGLWRAVLGSTRERREVHKDLAEPVRRTAASFMIGAVLMPPLSKPSVEHEAAPNAQHIVAVQTEPAGNNATIDSVRPGTDGHAKVPSSEGIHTIKSGDTLSEIAERYSSNVEELAEANSIEEPDVIYAGDEIRIPKTTGKHVVEAGDHPYDVAIKLGFNSVVELADANGLEIDWDYTSDQYSGPFLLLVPGMELHGAGVAEPDEAVEPSGESPADVNDNNQPETEQPEPEPDGQAEDAQEEPPKDKPQAADPPPSTPEPEEKEEAPKPEPEIPPGYEVYNGQEVNSDALAAAREVFDDVHKAFPDIIADSTQIEVEDPDRFIRIVDELASNLDDLPKSVAEKKVALLQYVADEEGVSTTESISAYLLEYIGGELYLQDDNDMAAGLQQTVQWFSEQIVKGDKSLAAVEAEIDLSPTFIIDALEYAFVGVEGLEGTSISEEDAERLTIERFSGRSIADMVDAKFQWLASEKGIHVIDVYQQRLAAIYTFYGINSEYLSEDEVKGFRQDYLEGKTGLHEFEEAFGEKVDSTKADIRRIFDVLHSYANQKWPDLVTPGDEVGEDRVMELVNKVFSGEKDYTSIRDGLAEYYANEAKEKSGKDVSLIEFYRVISWHILADHGWDESDRGKYDDDLGKAIAEGTITISQLEKAAQSGDIDQIKDLIITLIEVELPSGYTGAQIKVALIEKYGEGNSGKLDEDELEPVGDAWPGHKLYADAAVAFQMMAAAYKEEFGREIELTDSYRSYKEQVATKKEKGKYAAQPGHSNHGWGLAVDLGGGINDFGTRQHEWMRKHAEQFGFVLPNWAHDGKGIEEPWHWEYVGKPIDGNRDEDKRDDKEKEGKDQEKDKDKERNASPIEVYKDERLTKHLSSHYQTAEANRPPFNEAKHYSWNGQKGPMVPMRDIVILLASQGFRGEALVIATAISVPEAVGEYRDGEMWVPLYITGDKHLGDNSISTCFMQIHNSYESKAGDGSLLDPERLLDPLYCARLAKYKFDNGGFKHWTTYNEGKHLPYLDDAREAMEAVEAASGVDLGS